ncbi:MAG: hypothetical protein ABJC12_02005 [Saprospiraceae bacterium]
MEDVKSYLRSIPLGWLTALALVLCIPAFFIHLGTIAFIGDEGIRTLVALEMKITGHYIVPTLNGEPYFNKPPLYNWFILFTSTLYGSFGEWPTRITSLFFLGLFSLTVYFSTRKHFDRLTSISLTLMLLTSGRILFWDSMLGLIDICFSWIIYLNFITLYQLGSKGKWRLMFLISYLLCSVAFLLKGIPAAVFQGISVVAALFFHGAFKKKFFSSDHFTGAAIGLIPMLIYYIFYAQEVSLQNVFSILLDQSVQRTGVHFGFLQTVLHVFTFPLEQFYHFLPWSVLTVLFFHPQFRKWVREKPFVHFCFWMLVLNIPVYWFSVQVYPRYLLMFLPIFNMVGLYTLIRTKEAGQKWWKVLLRIFQVLSALVVLAILAMPFYQRAYILPGMIAIWIGGSLILSVCFLGLSFDSGRMFLWLTLILLFTRCVFNLVVLPLRSYENSENNSRDDARRLVQRHGDKAWYIYDKSELHEVARFYTTAEKNEIIHKAPEICDSTGYYFVDLCLYPDFPGRQIDSLILEKGRMISLMEPDHR